MLLMLNKKVVMVEMLEWAQLRLAEVMRVPPSSVVAKWGLNATGSLVPEFAVDEEEAAGVTRSEIREVFKAVSWEMKGMLKERLEGLKQIRPQPWLLSVERVS